MVYQPFKQPNNIETEEIKKIKNTSNHYFGLHDENEFKIPAYKILDSLPRQL